MIYFWFCVAMLVLWALIQIGSRIRAARTFSAARAEAQAGEWEQASRLYKQIVLRQLAWENFDVIERATGELHSLYRKHDTNADLSAILKGRRLFKEIDRTSVKDREKIKLKEKVRTEISRAVKSLPGAAPE